MKTPKTTDAQNQLVLNRLQSGRTITHWEALVELRIARLAARIHELRKQGWPIETHRDPTGQYAIYRLAKEDAA